RLSGCRWNGADHDPGRQHRAGDLDRGQWPIVPQQRLGTGMLALHRAIPGRARCYSDELVQFDLVLARSGDERSAAAAGGAKGRARQVSRSETPNLVAAAPLRRGRETFVERRDRGIVRQVEMEWADGYVAV